MTPVPEGVKTLALAARAVMSYCEEYPLNVGVISALEVIVAVDTVNAPTEPV